jgi:hypothetical protein
MGNVIDARITSLEHLPADVARASDLGALFLHPSELAYFSFQAPRQTREEEQSFWLKTFWQHLVTVQASRVRKLSP